MLNKELRAIPFLFMTLSLLVLMGCTEPWFKNDLEAIKAKGELKVITRNCATCYYEGPHGPVGFEYELSKAFAEHLGVKLNLVILESQQDMVLALLQGSADLIAAGVPATKHLREHVAFGPTYFEVRQQAVGLRAGPQPRKVKDLIGQPIWVGAGTSQEESLVKLRQQYPELSWMAVSGYDSEDLLEWVGRGIIPLTIADSDVFSVNRRYYPDLKVHFTIKSGQELAWAMHPQNVHLERAVYQWFAQPSTNALVKELVQHYFEHVKNFDYVDLTAYHRRVRNRLPKYRKYFEEAAERHGLDWKLVAAQAYQESHWNPRAKSFTGVRGMMMLTLETARRYGVKSRLDPKQVIYAGVRHLARLHRRVGDKVKEPDRTFMALAAYNVGLGHLEDARTLTTRRGKDPNSWHDVRENLPLLRKKKYYRSLRHGYARGIEPVLYVDRIRTYYQILAQHIERNEDGPKAGILNQKAH